MISLRILWKKFTSIISQLIFPTLSHFDYYFFWN